MSTAKTNKGKTEMAATRVDEATLQKFDKRAAKFKKDRSTMIRELMIAFGEDRVTIQPTKEEKGLYNVD